MESVLKTAKKILIVCYLIVLHAAVIYLGSEKIGREYFGSNALPASAIPDPLVSTPVPTPVIDPTLSYDAPTAEANAASPTPRQPLSEMPSDRLLIPVAGVRPEQLVDSFSDARSDGRVHDAIDIPAPAGTPVLAAVNGQIVGFLDSEKGGVTIYQLSIDRKFVYYYAHLQRRADDIFVTETVKQGRTLGYVGDTGNAGAGNFHLHFSIAAVADPKRYWEGTNINPYPLLKSGIQPK